MWTRIRGLPITGRCPSCGYRIGPGTGAVEVVTGVAFATLAWSIHQPAMLAVLCVVTAIAVTLSFVDIRVHRLPNWLVLLGLSISLVSLTVGAVNDHDYRRLLLACTCAAAMAVLYGVLAVLPRGFGIGDVKLAFVVGLITGWYGPPAAVLATFIAWALGAVVALTLFALRRRTGMAELPFGPFMAIGALIAVTATAGQ